MAYMCKLGYGECDACGKCVLKESVKCPVCGFEPEKLYSSDGAIIGCDRCIEVIDVEDYEQEEE